MTALSPVELLQRLIRCPSVTPAEGGAIALIADVLRDAGFAVETPVFSEEGTPDIVNLFARIGTAAPCLVFAGHTDVVPPGDAAAWTHPPFGGVIADGFIYGRGACDMKGGVAAAVAAVVNLIAAEGPPAGSIAFLITGDEEGPAVNGTSKLLEWAAARGERFDHCILGEPTNPAALGEMLKIGRRGSLTGRVTVQGRQGHVAYPHLAANPIPVLLEALAALRATPLDDGTAHFDPSNIEVVTIDVGNPSSNVIPAAATARFNIRFNDRWTPETLMSELRRRLPEPAAGPQLTLAFEPCNARAFVTEPGAFTALVADAVAAEAGRRPVASTTGGTSDARFIVTYCPVVEFGLVGASMHAVDESALVDDVAALTRIYARVMHDYFATPRADKGERVDRGRASV